MAVWDSIIRFEAGDGSILFAPLPLLTTPVVGLKVEGYRSIDALEAGGGGRTEVVRKLLAPVPVTGIPIVCIGVNYKSHAEEGKMVVPTHPRMWYKPPACLADPGEDIPIDKQVYENFPDFEGEITIVIRKAAKNVSPEEVPSYILGYTIGNDLTGRFWQAPARARGQFTYAKGFDKFGPIGPRLVSPKVFQEQCKEIETRVNNKVFQKSALDFIFKPVDIVSFLTQGTTIPAGTAIMTGTPGGVGWYSKPRYALKSGDVVEVEVKPIGILRNKVFYVDRKGTRL